MKKIINRFLILFTLSSCLALSVFGSGLLTQRTICNINCGKKYEQCMASGTLPAICGGKYNNCLNFCGMLPNFGNPVLPNIDSPITSQDLYESIKRKVENAIVQSQIW
jgi:hypothetical protein